MTTAELLFRLREIMPEIGENPVADEMYNIVKETLEDSTILGCEIRKTVCSRELDRSDRYEDSFSDNCVWCDNLGDGMLLEDYCSNYHPNFKTAKEE